MYRKGKSYVFTGIAVLLLLFTNSCKEKVIAVKDLHLPDLNELFQGYDQLDSTKAYTEFAEKLISANRDLQSSEIFVEAASLYHQAGNDDKIAELLNTAIDKGMANPKILSKFQNLYLDQNDESVKHLYHRLDSIQKKLQEVSHFSMEMESMNLFWSYFERARKDTANARAVLKEFVFEGPRELRDFYAVRYNNIDNMYGQMINGAPNYYSYLKDQFNPDSLIALKSKTTQWMQNFKNMYPPAVFPKVYVVPGILNSGGTATEMGMFVGGDMYGKSENMPTDGLNDWQKGAIMKFEDLPKLTIHELMHFQQNYGDTRNSEKVIGGIIGEGVYDFLVELCSGEQLKNENLRYLEDQENNEMILADLKKDLFTTDFSRWLYNGDFEDRPYDLGYTMGYLITKSYYANQKDKKAAIAELLNTNDFTGILEGSAYAHLLN
ncbi:MAG: DUF2268 domain-containing protein [Eudoraea sp.]|nr:DUF2268 domain-containing protein [Eudoraea sp.]